MANSDYVGRYGAALRKLQALEMGGLPGVPGTMSQTEGAFGGMPPEMGAPQQAPAQGPMQGPPPQAGAFDRAEPKPMFDKPMSASDLYAQMPAEQKQLLLQQVEKNGMSVDKRFDQLVATGEIPQVPKKKKLTKEEKLGYLAEVALRTISNMGREGTTSFTDWADATLQTNERRGALERAEQEQARQQAEVLRKEGREDARETRQVGREEGREQRDTARATATIQTNQEFQAEQARLDRESREREARLRAEQDKRANEKVLVAADGSMFTLGQDGKAKPITTTKEVVEERKGKRGVTVKIRKMVDEQLKAMPKADVAGIDKDTIMREIGNRIKALKEDGKLGRELKRKGVADVEGEIARRATAQVMQEYGVVTGKQPEEATTPSGGLSAEDQTLLDKWSQAQ